jgi:hypothetical protein
MTRKRVRRSRRGTSAAHSGRRPLQLPTPCLRDPPACALRQVVAFLQTRLTDFSDCRTPADIEFAHIGALKTILSEVAPYYPRMPSLQQGW